MPTLIKEGRVVADDWTFVDALPEDRAMAHVVLPLDYALAHAEALRDSGRKIGVCLPGDAEPGQIAPLLPQVSLIAIQFPAFNDGRGLSLAVLLRSRHGFRGELRAIGDVHEDVLHYMHRCGFDSFQLPDGRDPAVALKTLNSLTDFYQGSVLNPLPAFRRIRRGTTGAL